MEKSKLNILLMRDNANVRRYRLSPFWIRLVVYLAVFLVLLAAGGGYAGFRYWKENRGLVKENRKLRRDIMEARMELERLENIDKIIKSNDPEELQSLIGSVSAKMQNKTPAQPPLNLNNIFEYVDLDQVRVDDLQAKFNGNSLRVSFHLNNMLAEGALVGRADIRLLASDGTILDVRANKSEMAFNIQRFKRISTSIPLPKKYSRDTLFALKLEIRNDQDQIIYSETFPLAHILA